MTTNSSLERKKQSETSWLTEDLTKYNMAKEGEKQKWESKHYEISLTKPSLSFINCTLPLYFT